MWQSEKIKAFSHIKTAQCFEPSVPPLIPSLPCYSEVGLHIWDTLNGAAWFSSVLARLRHWGREGRAGLQRIIRPDFIETTPQGQIKPCLVATEMGRRAGMRTTSKSLSNVLSELGRGCRCPHPLPKYRLPLGENTCCWFNLFGTPPPSSVLPVPSGLQVLASVHSSQPSEDRNTSPWRQPGWMSGASFEAKAIVIGTVVLDLIVC